MSTQLFRRLKPYFTAFRIRALLETQYRGAALGGLITQVFFGLVYIFLYQAFFDGNNPEYLRDTVTYVWLQQMFFRVLLSNDNELQSQILSGSIAYTLCRPVDQQLYWLCRGLAQQTVGALMRAFPMLLIQFLLPADIHMALPDSPLAFGQFLLSMLIGFVCVAQIHTITMAVTMKTLDHRGLSAMINLIMMTFAGNVIPLTLFPDSLQLLIRYQPFAQALDAPIRMYQQAQPMGEWLLSIAVQVGWTVILTWLSRLMWRRQLTRVTVQGG